MIPLDIALPVKTLFLAPITAILFGFFVMRRIKPEWTHWPILVSCAAVTASSAIIAAYVLAGKGFDQPLWHWAVTGDWGVSFGLRIDGPGAAVLAMVAFVGSLIHVYAAGYMKGDPGFSRFFLIFHLFFLAMIGLLTANDYAQIYLFWELVGVASYLLVGFWYHKASARRASLQAFMTNRVGDLGFLIAVLVMLAAFKTTRLQLVYLHVAAGHTELVSLIAIGLIWAAFAKSAQWPLYFWLPDAMEGPTPTSALMHAATMVTAGVFLLIRSWPLIDAVEGLPHLIAWVGAGTALGSALIAGTKKDLKRILAYSTVSHLGLMMLALGLGQIGVAVFHLIVHGFFKAALFLCAGNIAHALHQPTANVDDVGGLFRPMRLTYACFLVSALSLAGVFPFGGFFSKDAILDAAWHHGGALSWVSLCIAALSAFYIFRMLFLAFHGNRKEQNSSARDHAHEAEPILIVPVMALSIGAAVIGIVGHRLVALLNSGWTLVPPGAPMMPGSIELPHLNILVAGLGTAMTVIGFGAAYCLTMIDAGWDWRWRGGFLEAVFDSDFGWKNTVRGAVSLVRAISRWIGNGLDACVLDRAVESTATGAVSLAGVIASAARGRINDYLWWMVVGTALLLGRVMR